MAKLSDVCEINPRFSPLSSDDGELASFVPMASVSEVSGSIVEEQVRPVASLLKGFTPFRDRDVLVAKITPCFENGKIAHARISHRYGFGSTEFHVLRPDPAKVDDRYLFHFMRQQWVRAEGEKRMTGSGGQRRVPRQFLEDLDLPAPSLSEQRRIAAILDKADALRAKRREAITKIDHLLQSAFFEMFGSSDGSDFPIVELDDVCDRITDGAHFTPTYVDKGVPFLRVTDVQSKEIDWDSTKKIPFVEHQELRKRCDPERGDVLYSKNGTIGIPKLVDWDDEFSIFVSLALLKPNRLKLRGDFLESFLRTPFALKQAIGRSKTGTVTNLHLVEIRQVKMPLPSIDLQDQWIRVRDLVAKKQSSIDFSLVKIEQLIESLQQQAFFGVC